MSAELHADLLRDMVLFVELARALNLSRAAAVLGVPASTLSRRISGLEKHLGAKLFHRTTRRIVLTEAGGLYFSRCETIVEVARKSADDLKDLVNHPRGLLCVSAPVDFVMTFLAVSIARFARRYPEIRFDFDLSPRRADLVGENVDLAIRIGLLPDSSMIARRIATMQNRLFASPAYLRMHGTPNHPDELAVHECLNIEHSQADARRWTLTRDSETVEVEMRGRFEMNNVGMVRALALEGFGIGQLFDGGPIADDISAGRLVRVLPEWEGRPQAVHAITKARVLPVKTRLFVEFLVQELEVQFGPPIPTRPRRQSRRAARRKSAKEPLNNPIAKEPIHK